MTFGEWLSVLGLGHYAQTFVANDIDFDVIGELTEADLEALGLTLGHRKRLIKAIAERQSAGPASAPQSHAPAVAPAGVAEAQRRQLTVLFCDLVGSTELANRLDPEDLRTILHRYQNVCTEIVERYEGVVAKFLGDGVLAYFGFPLAHEDDAERAIRAALDLTRKVGAIEIHGAVLSARVGIATGLVVVGEISDASNSVMGTTPNLAARLQAEAPAGGVLIARSTRLLGGEWFDYEELGERMLKGIAEPVALVQVKGERTAESRFAAVRASQLSPFVGRIQEVGLLLDRWRMAADGEGQIVLLSGEAGIGKSRIAETFRERIRDEDHICLRYQCSPHHTNSAFHPIIAHLRAAAGIVLSESPQTQLDKLEALVGTASAAILAGLLLIRGDCRYPVADLTPEQQKAQFMRILVERLLELARQKPVLFLFEDAHWIDPSTRELLDQCITPVRQNRILMVITARPEFHSVWSAHAHFSSLTLNRLGQRQCAELIAGMTAALPLSDDLRRSIVERADGVPLFLEELTKSILEAGPQSTAAIPATLQDSLRSRLDRLAAAKDVAQIGACIGREFPYALVREVAGLSDQMLRAALAELESSALVFRRGEGDDAIYHFKHALVQDVAQTSLLRGRRQELHQQIAFVMESKFPELIASQPEMMAMHYFEAAKPLPAAHRWLQAGRLSVSRSAMQEALVHLNRGLSALDGAAPGEERDRLELDLQIAAGSANLTVKGYGSAEAEAAYMRAHTLLRDMEDDPRRFAVQYGLFILRWNRGDLEPAARTAAEMLEDARQFNNRVGLCVANRSLATAYNVMARYPEAEAAAAEAVRHYDRASDKTSASQYGLDFGVGAFSHLMLARAFLGDVEGAERAERDAYELAEAVGSKPTICFTLMLSSIRNLIDGDFARLTENSARLLQLGQELELRFWRAIGQCLCGVVRLRSDPAYATSQIGVGLSDLSGQLNILFHPVLLCAQADGLIELGLLEEAAAALNEAEHAAARGLEWWNPEICRVRAMLKLARGEDRKLIVADLEQAIAIARSQKALVFERRAEQALLQL